jgi:hypothetical protein
VLFEFPYKSRKETSLGESKELFLVKNVLVGISAIIIMNEIPKPQRHQCTMVSVTTKVGTLKSASLHVSLHVTYHKVASSNTSRLEAHAGHTT